MRARLTMIGAVAVVTLAACGQPRDAAGRTIERTEAAERRHRLEERLAASDTGTPPGPPLARWILPADLREVSGLALTESGQLLVHGDEQGRLAVVDPRSGMLLKRFSIGATDVRDDFEGITLVNGVIHLMTSDAKLYQFQEGTHGSRVPYTVQNTGLADACEFEGVAFDSTRAALVLPCKNVEDEALEDHLVIWRWLLDGTAGQRATRLTIPLSAIARGDSGWSALHPSDIAIDPATGHYLIVAAQERALVELTPEGAVVRTLRLTEDHPQAEGVALSRDALLMVSDEARGRPPTITLYRWSRRAGSAEGPR